MKRALVQAKTRGQLGAISQYAYALISDLCISVGIWLQSSLWMVRTSDHAES